MDEEVLTDERVHELCDEASDVADYTLQMLHENGCDLCLSTAVGLLKAAAVILKGIAKHNGVPDSAESTRQFAELAAISFEQVVIVGSVAVRSVPK